MYDINTIEDQKFYLSGAYLEGLQGFTTNWTYPDENAVSLGFAQPVGDYHEGSLEGEVTLNRLIVSSGDPLAGFFEGGISGHLAYGDNKSYIFTQGFISNYSCECSVEELPQLTTTIRTFGEMLGTSGTSPIQPGPESHSGSAIFLPNQGDVKLEITNHNHSDPLLDITTDAVQSFDYDINIEWEPLYTIGDLGPQDYMNKPPTVEVSMTIDLNQNVSPDFRDQVCSPTLKDLTLKVMGCADNCSDTKTTIRQFHIPCARLISYSNVSSDLGALLGEFVFRSSSTAAGDLRDLLIID